jgi:large subunit ribosomal protein L18
LISDDSGCVIASESTQNAVENGKSAKSVESAKKLGMRIAELAKGSDITSVVFDRNGYRYHGRVAAVAEGAREGGLEF